MAGALYWYQHLGTTKEKDAWTNDGVARQVGTNLKAGPNDPLDWNRYLYLFPAEDGVIYGVDKDGCLYWHQHLARSEGLELARSWAERNGVHRVQVGGGLGVKWKNYLPDAQGSSSIRPHLFAADHGVIYGVDPSGCLHWYQHRGRGDGSDDWAADSGKQIGACLTRREPPRKGIANSGGDLPNDWNYKMMFAADDGVIYGVQGYDDTVNGRLFWYRHLGRGNGSDCFAKPIDDVHSVHIGSAWNYDQVSAADNDVIYGVFLTTKAPLFWYRHTGHSDGRTEWANGQTGVEVSEPGTNGYAVHIDWTQYKQVFAAEDNVIYAVSKM